MRAGTIARYEEALREQAAALVLPTADGHALSVHPHRRNTDPSLAITTTFPSPNPVLLSCLQHAARHCKRSRSET
jgi:hypothetical protein